MRGLKIICVFFFAWAVVDIVRGILMIHSTNAGALAMSHGLRGTILSVVYAAFWGAAIYGIHRRGQTAWKLGWAAIVFLFLLVLVLGLQFTRRIPKSSAPWVASLAVVVADSALALSLGFWWYRQKSYFVKPVPLDDRRK